MGGGGGGMVPPPGGAAGSQSPDRIYAEGLSHLVERFGVNREFARSFVLLAFATFIYDTLDVATRLGRYVFQELTGWKDRWGSVWATLATLALPALSVSWTMTDASGKIVPAWRVFWTLFGTSNQLLAALTLTAITVWLKRTKGPWLVSAIQASFMVVMTLWSLVLMIRPPMNWIAFIALVLLVLAVLVLFEGVKAFLHPSTK